jgi:hypothetical protein
MRCYNRGIREYKYDDIAGEYGINVKNIVNSGTGGDQIKHLILYIGQILVIY